MPVRTGSVHANILTKPSRPVFAVIRLELIEPGAATCVYNEARPRERSDRGRFSGMPGPFLKAWIVVPGMSVCVTQHRNWPLRSTILNAHDTMPVRTGSVHAHILTKPSRAVLLQFV